MGRLWHSVLLQHFVLLRKKKIKIRQLYQRDQKAKKSLCDVQVLLLSTVHLSVISVGAGLGLQLGEWTHREFLGSYRLYLRIKSRMCRKKKAISSTANSLYLQLGLYSRRGWLQSRRWEHPKLIVVDSSSKPNEELFTSPSNSNTGKDKQ